MQMQMRYRILALVTACCLTLNGCSQEAPKPPPDATVDTPMLDIEEGIEVAPDALGTKTETPTPDTGGGAAQSDAEPTTGGQ